MFLELVSNNDNDANTFSPQAQERERERRESESSDSLLLTPEAFRATEVYIYILLF
jgi:hypothetical protein